MWSESLGSAWSSEGCFITTATPLLPDTLQLQRLIASRIRDSSFDTIDTVGIQLAFSQMRSSHENTMSTLYRRAAAGKLERAPFLITEIPQP